MGKRQNILGTMGSAFLAATFLPIVGPVAAISAIAGTAAAVGASNMAAKAKAKMDEDIQPTGSSIFSSNKQKMNFLKGLIRVAKSDGVTDPKELIYFEQIALAIGISQDEMEIIDALWDSNDAISISFDTYEQKIFFFMEAIQLCWIDNDYTEAERAEINKIAEELHIDRDIIERISDWVREGMEWSNKGKDFLKQT